MTAKRIEDRADGNFIKILEVIDEGLVFFGRTTAGGTARFSLDSPLDLQRGDVIFVTDAGKLHRAPDTAWPEATSLGVVRKILDDGIVLETSSGGMRVLAGPQTIAVEPDNTVEYTDVDGIIRVVAETPLRYRDPAADEDAAKYIMEPGEEELSFDSFGGYETVIERAKELIETQLERAAELKKIGAKPVKGVIFTGSPGTGKTHLARIIAHVSGATFYVVSGPSIVSQYVGVSEATLRQLFMTAAKQERAIIFFDEIDSIASDRGSDTNGEAKRVVAQLLTLLDGFTGDNVMVIAATNRVEDIDEALLRPGRFDWEIEFPLPTESDRYEILRIGATRLATVDPLPLADIARLTESWSGARLTAIWTEAALIAAGDARTAITGEDMAIAYDRVRSRPTRQRDEDKT